MLLGYGYQWWRKHGFKRKEDMSVNGIRGAGKSTFEYCLGYRQGEAVYDYGRVETMQSGKTYVGKIPGARTHFRGVDRPGEQQYVETEMAREPIWTTLWTDLQRWDDPENWAFMEKIVDHLTSDEYRERVAVTGKKCKLFTIFLNKMDYLIGFHPLVRGEILRSIARIYLADHVDNPLSRLKGYIHYDFVAVSLYDAQCYKYPNFYGDSMDLKDYLIEVSEKK